MHWGKLLIVFLILDKIRKIIFLIVIQSWPESFRTLWVEIQKQWWSPQYHKIQLIMNRHWVLWYMQVELDSFKIDQFLTRILKTYFWDSMFKKYKSWKCCFFKNNWRMKDWEKQKVILTRLDPSIEILKLLIKFSKAWLDKKTTIITQCKKRK